MEFFSQCYKIQKQQYSELKLFVSKVFMEHAAQAVFATHTKRAFLGAPSFDD